MSLLVSEMLQERYEVVRSIKSGGMGSVYEAVDHKLASTPCAIKEVLASALQGSAASYVLQSFESEMRALAGLEHPNIPRVRDYFEIDGKRYIVLDLVQGQALDDELAEHLRLTHEPMDPAVAAVDMVQVLETLSYLHNCQPPIIHRDIKSANLIRDTRSGRIKLVDFGIARSVETQKVQTQVGTPGFCAPEQMGGRAEVRSDLYSVGATLYHLCTGRLPPAFTFDALEMDLPRHPGLVKIVLKATQPKPQDRYANAEEMAQALRAWLRNEGSSKIDPATLPPAPEVTRINPLATAPLPANSQNGLWVAVLAMLLAALGLLYNDYNSRFGSATPTPIASPGGTKVFASPSPAPRPAHQDPQPLEKAKKAALARQKELLAQERADRERLEKAGRERLLRAVAERRRLAALAPERAPRAELVAGNYPHALASGRSFPLSRSAPTPSGEAVLPSAPPYNPSALARLPERLNGLSKTSPGPYRAIYQGNIDSHQIELTILSSPGHSVAALRAEHPSEWAGMTENPANEGPGEYCGYRIEGGQHRGVHFKDGLAYKLLITPPPPSNSPVWPAVLDIIKNYP